MNPTAAGTLVPHYTPVPVASVGRVVHYVLAIGPWKGEHRPAIITQVWQADTAHPQAPGMSNLCVFCGQSQDFEGDPNRDQRGLPVVALGSIYYSAEHAPGTWHWPERA